MLKMEPLSCLSVADREKRMRSFLLKGSRFDIWEQIKEEKIKIKSIVQAVPKLCTASKLLYQHHSFFKSLSFSFQMYLKPQTINRD